MNRSLPGRARLWRFTVPHLAHNEFRTQLEAGRYVESATIVFPGDWQLLDHVQIRNEWGGVLMSVTRVDVQLLNAMETTVRYRTMTDQLWSLKLPLGMFVPEPGTTMRFVVTTNENRKPAINDPVYAMVLLDYQP